MVHAAETRTTERTLVFGTGNRKKAAELAALAAPLGLTLQTLADFPAPLEIDETGASFAENAALKASRQAAHLGRWVLGDDSGLAVEALAGVPAAKRTAHFVCHLALADPHGTIRATSSARCQGRIRETESGTGGFGYDPLFEIVEYHRTFGELSPEVKAVLSHRARAMFAILPAIQALLASGEWTAG